MPAIGYPVGFGMDSPDWERIKDVFASALEKPAADRDVFIDAACGGDLSLATAVRRLLSADRGAGDFLERRPLSQQPSLLPHSEPNPLLESGALIGDRFEIVRLLGEGGMGQVYEAFDRELGENVAVKTVHPHIANDAVNVQRFKQEVFLTRRITHPHVCRIFDFQRHVPNSGTKVSTEFSFLTMELLHGETLAATLKRRGPLQEAEAASIAMQISEGLAAAHQAGIVHRDLKPSNIQLEPQCDHVRAVVTDFGLALAIRDESLLDVRNQTGPPEAGVIGTLAYMSPEQLENRGTTSATDIYALGLIMFEMVAGKRPFEDTVVFSEAVKRLTQAPPLVRTLAPDVSDAWQATVQKCLARDPWNRFSKAIEIREAIERHNESVAGMVPVATGQKRVRMWAVVTTAAIVAISLGLLSLRDRIFRYHEQVQSPAAGAKVLLVNFQNTSGDPRLASVGLLIRRQLSESGFFSMIEPPQTREVLRQMTRAENSALDPPTAREVAMRLGAQRVVYGSIGKTGGEYTLDISVEQPDNVPTRARAYWEKHWNWAAIPLKNNEDIPADLLAVVRDASGWVRRQIGETANDVATLDAPPEDVTTDKWTALLAYSEAEQLNAKQDRQGALVALRNALSADPHFDFALMREGDLLISMNREIEGYRAYDEALREESARRLTRRERDRLLGIFAIDTHNYPAAIRAFEDYSTFYPNDYLGWFYRGFPLMELGRTTEAIRMLEHAAELEPNGLSPAIHLARYYLLLGEFAQSHKWTRVLRKNGYVDAAGSVEGIADFLQGDYQRASTEFASLQTSKDALFRSLSFSWSASVAAEQGRYDEATRLLNAGIASDLADDNTVNRASKLLQRGFVEMKENELPQAVRDAKSAVALDKGLRNSLQAATLLGRIIAIGPSGLRTQCISELEELERNLPKKRFAPLSDIVEYHVQGEVLLAKHKTKQAVEEFQKAAEIDSPLADREPLARALMADAEAPQQSSSNARKEMHEALDAYRRLAMKPAVIWESPHLFFPGYACDEVLAFSKLAARLGEIDAGVKSALAPCVERMSKGGSQTADILWARHLTQAAN